MESGRLLFLLRRSFRVPWITSSARALICSGFSTTSLSVTSTCPSLQAVKKRWRISEKSIILNQAHLCFLLKSLIGIETMEFSYKIEIICGFLLIALLKFSPETAGQELKIVKKSKSYIQ